VVSSVLPVTRESRLLVPPSAGALVSASRVRDVVVGVRYRHPRWAGHHAGQRTAPAATSGGAGPNSPTSSTVFAPALAGTWVPAASTIWLARGHPGGVLGQCAEYCVATSMHGWRCMWWPNRRQSLTPGCRSGPDGRRAALTPVFERGRQVSAQRANACHSVALFMKARLGPDSGRMRAAALPGAGTPRNQPGAMAH
jgi:hypothetical protein